MMLEHVTSGLERCLHIWQDDLPKTVGYQYLAFNIVGAKYYRNMVALAKN
jgi:hypothetical protein